MPIVEALSGWSRRPRECPRVPRLSRVAMGDPAAYDVLEIHNVHQLDASGRPQRVDRARARAQWSAMAGAYRAAGVEVTVLPSPPGLADFCFSANPSLVLPLPDGSREMWLSRMANASRRGEVASHEDLGRRAGLRVREMPPQVARFEGTGDGILHPERFVLHAGVGPRSDRAAWEALAAAHPDLDLLVYRLANPSFYHLDTALAPIDETRALVVEEAFDAAGLELARAAFPNAFAVPLDEALRFAANAHSPDGRRVFLQRGCARTEAWLRSQGLEPVPLETDEFLKSGGSVFCLKLAW